MVCKQRMLLQVCRTNLNVVVVYCLQRIVPQEVNKFFTDSGNARCEYPVGVYFYKQSGKFHARCNVNGKRQYLGRFNTPEEAFAVYKPFKENLCKQLALKWQSEIDERLFNAMMNWQIRQI